MLLFYPQQGSKLPACTISLPSCVESDENQRHIEHTLDASVRSPSPESDTKAIQPCFEQRRLCHKVERWQRPLPSALPYPFVTNPGIFLLFSLLSARVVVRADEGPVLTVAKGCLFCIAICRHHFPARGMLHILRCHAQIAGDKMQSDSIAAHSCRNHRHCTWYVCIWNFGSPAKLSINQFSSRLIRR